MMEPIALKQLFNRTPVRIKHFIPQFVVRSENDIRKDKYERYYETVRKEAYLHLCHHHYFDEMHSSIKQWILDQISEIDFNNCIDLGCGVGHWSGWLASTFKDVTVTGIDLSYQLLKVAYSHWMEGMNEVFHIQENGFLPLEAKGMQSSNLNFVQADMMDLPIKHNTADLILSVLSIDRVMNVDKVIEDVYRILKPGGHFLIISPFNFQYAEQWNKLNPVDQFICLFKSHDWNLKSHQHSIPYFTPMDVRNNRVVYDCDGLLFQKNHS